MSSGNPVPDRAETRVPVLLMSHSLGHGGGERQLAMTALSLDRSRFQPHVACCHGGFWAARLREADVPFFFIGSRSLMSAAALSEAWRLRRYIREHGIRIVQTFDFSMNIFGIPVALSTPGVISISNQRCHMDLVPSRYRWLTHMLHRLSSAVIVNSEALRALLRDDYGVSERRIFTCHNGIDTQVFHAGPRRRLPGLEEASLVIGTLCVLRPEKNLRLLLEAFAVVSRTRPGIRLLITGSGPEEPALRDQAERLGLKNTCVFQASTSDVPRSLASMDVFVLPSLTEGLSNAVMEAMASGCCVIASDVGGNSELIANGVSGLLFSSQNLDALVEQLAAVIDEPDKRSSLAAAGALRMSSGFSLARAADRMQEIYSTLLKRRRS